MLAIPAKLSVGAVEVEQQQRAGVGGCGHGEAAGGALGFEVFGCAVAHALYRARVERRRHIEVPILGTAPYFGFVGRPYPLRPRTEVQVNAEAIRAGAARRQRQRRRNG